MALPSPYRLAGLKGYKVQISSASLLAEVHPSFHHLRLQAVRVCLCLNPTYSLFTAAILLQRRCAEVEMFPELKLNLDRGLL